MSVQEAIEIEGEPTALYRLFSADGTLLYVGITNNLTVRFGQHANDKPWWPQVACRTMAWHGSRKVALDAESAAILAESPLHNIAGKSSADEYDLDEGDRLKAEYRDKIAVTVATLLRAEPARLTRPPSPPPPEPTGRDLALEGPAYMYESVADHIEARIRAGEIPLGAKLPGEQALRQEYGIALSTARKAMGLLRDRGLVVTRPAKGSFVKREIPPQNDGGPR